MCGSGYSRVPPIALIASVWLGACGSSGTSATADPPDAGGIVCQFLEGPSYVMSHLAIVESDQGFDIDGDGAIDNTFGAMPQSVIDSTNEGFAGSLASGETLMIATLTDWTDPPTPTDPDVAFHLFVGEDYDSPPDPSNNFSGEGKMYVSTEQFDLNCQSKSRADETTLVDGVLTASRSSWFFRIPTGTGTVRFPNARFNLTFDPDFHSVSGLFGSAVTICSLNGFPFPGDTPGSVLDSFVNDPTLSSVVHVDQDLDGDGLEQVLGDGQTIRACIDGDGTVIEGRDCPCHPAIADAYSWAAELSAVRVEVVGVVSEF
jgi:hypothetical protein